MRVISSISSAAYDGRSDDEQGSHRAARPRGERMPVTGRSAPVLRVALLAAGVAFGVAAMSPSQSPARPASPGAGVIVDTDAGPDDVMALALLLASPKVRVEAVCIGTGLAHVPAGAANILRVLELAGRSDVPVYMGRETPISGSRQFPAEWRRLADRLGGVTLPAARRRPESRPAREFLAERLRDSARPVDVLALGGLTNLAEAFQIAPAAARGIRQLVIMGGAVGVPGNLVDGGVTRNRTAEWNFFVDPEAARRVFASGAPIRLIPLDATRRVTMDWTLARDLRNAGGAPLARAVVEVLATIGQLGGRASYVAGDTVAAATLIDPGVVRFKPAGIMVRRHAPEDGRTVALRGGAKRNAQVAIDADASRFRTLFIATLSGHHPPGN
jgi:inosine-uridine nucleoside N-ribohydrolase